MGRVEIMPAQGGEESELRALRELGLTVVLEHLLTNGMCPPALFAPVCRCASGNELASSLPWIVPVPKLMSRLFLCKFNEFSAGEVKTWEVAASAGRGATRQ